MQNYLKPCPAFSLSDFVTLQPKIESNQFGKPLEELVPPNTVKVPPILETCFSYLEANGEILTCIHLLTYRHTIYYMYVYILTCNLWCAIDTVQC